MTAASSSDRVAVLSRSFSRHPTLRAELLARYPEAVFNETGRTLSRDEIPPFVAGARKMIVALEKIDAALLESLGDVKVISKYGVGLDNVDLEAAARLGMRVGWTGGVNARSVAELTVCLMIACLRGVVASNLEVRSGVFRQNGGGMLAGRTVGLIGCGHVGHALAPLLKPFGCRLLVHDIRAFPDFYAEVGAEAVSLEELVAEADIVSLHVPLTSRTRGLIDAAMLERMRPGAILINTARGGIVIEAALKAALRSARLSAAALDVFDPEPPTDPELLALPNFIATPHIGGSPLEAVLAMGRAAIAGLDAAVDPLEHVPEWGR